MSASDRIRNLLTEREDPLAVREIAEIIKIDRKVARARLSELVKRGEIYRPFHGYYQCVPTYGVERDPPLIHDLCAVSKVDFDLEHHEKTIMFKSRSPSGPSVFRIRIVVGKTRNKITWTVKSPSGMDLDKFRLTKALVESELSRINMKFPEMWSINCHINWDYSGLRISGLKEVTWSAFDSTMERLYNKGQGIRYEVIPSRSMKVEEIEALFKRGVRDYQNTRLLIDLNMRMDQLEKTIKNFNSDMSNFMRLLETISNRFLFIQDQIVQIKSSLGFTK